MTFLDLLLIMRDPAELVPASDPAHDTRSVADPEVVLRSAAIL
jgi:hypothetical protein